MNYDIIVVGAGHAGCEAALAGARLNNKVLLITMHIDHIAMLACNPSIGGTGKGHIVKEIDALGGQMGKVIDKTLIQSKMLNTAKGPAVHSLRAQADKHRYSQEMRKVIENTNNLRLVEGEVSNLIIEDDSIKGVKLLTQEEFYAKKVIITTGTYLKSKIFIGDVVQHRGPNGLTSAENLSNQLNDIISIRRFKTGTPPRINANTVDYDKMEKQLGDEVITPFSFETENINIDSAACYLTYTNKNTHELVKKNIHKSSMYSGMIEGTGPRYCPSIEDKINRFFEKERHQLFIEPEGLDTIEQYVQGMSTSLPVQVQLAFLRTIQGLENVEIVRPGYAIEYDCINSLELNNSLESKNIKGLYFAGQINGSSGYEEAAGQGLLAGINASLSLKDKRPLVLSRSQSYIGVLIDDLVTKGTNEPYRMMTSRCEYRLVLRQDNADMRLTQIGYDIGLISEVRYNKFKDKLNNINVLYQLLDTSYLFPKDITDEKLELSNKVSYLNLLKRPDITIDYLKKYNNKLDDFSKEVLNQCEIELKYEGYIKKQLKQIENFEKMEKKAIPESIDYNDISGLKIEAIQKLSVVRPETVGRASRISGVSPADIQLILVHLEKIRRNNG